MSSLPSRCSFTNPAVGYTQAGAGKTVLLLHGSASSAVLPGAWRGSPSASTHHPPIATGSRPGIHQCSWASTRKVILLPKPRGFPAGSATGGFHFRTASQTTQAAAARAGYGIALLPRFVAADDRGLVQVMPKERLPERDVWLLIRRDLTRV